MASSYRREWSNRLMADQNSIIASIRPIAQELAVDLARIEALIVSGTAEDALYTKIAHTIGRCLDKLRATGVLGQANEVPSSVLWNTAGHWLAKGWMQHRARDKPRGYAGDFELLARMHENRLCDDPLGRLFDRYFQDQPAPKAVRNRMAMIADWIVNELHAKDAQSSSIHVGIVGSAFGLEIRDALWRVEQSARDRLRVTLIDLDPAAIHFAREQLAPLLPTNRLTAVSASMFRLPQRPQDASALDGAKLLFCPGLFDYLDDGQAADMLRCLYARLAPGGRLAVFQFAPHDPTRAYMEWIANWYLTYRDTEGLRRIVALARLADAQCTFGSEAEGVDLFVSVHRL
jgi:extracellular factor (EF) 3-hydroxypalmitic acid methyl ester biosynthesis protein